MNFSVRNSSNSKRFGVVSQKNSYFSCTNSNNFSKPVSSEQIRVITVSAWAALCSWQIAVYMKFSVRSSVSTRWCPAAESSSPRYRHWETTSIYSQDSRPRLVLTVYSTMSTYFTKTCRFYWGLPSRNSQHSSQTSNIYSEETPRQTWRWRKRKSMEKRDSVPWHSGGS